VRRAYQVVLSGNVNYAVIAHLLHGAGIVNVKSGTVSLTDRGARSILSNPIWMGWRIVDHKRTGGEHYTRHDGRQAGRRKVRRAPEEVIQVRVIDRPLLSEADWKRAQEVMAHKAARHWRSQPGYETHFTYHGHLTCSLCGEMLYSSHTTGRHHERKDFYVCKGRRVSHTCDAPYQRREKLEPMLDGLLARELSSRAFLRTCIDTLKKRESRHDGQHRTQRLISHVHKLQARREKVVDIYLEGAIGREERDRRLADVDRDLQTAQSLLLQQQPAQPKADVESLVDLLAPLAEWEYWSVEQKRRMLATVVPDIIVANYQVKSLGIRLHRDEERHTRAASCRSAILHRQGHASSGRRPRSRGSTQ